MRWCSEITFGIFVSHTLGRTVVIPGLRRATHVTTNTNSITHVMSDKNVHEACDNMTKRAIFLFLRSFIVPLLKSFSQRSINVGDVQLGVSLKVCNLPPITLTRVGPLMQGLWLLPITFDKKWTRVWPTLVHEWTLKCIFFISL